MCIKKEFNDSEVFTVLITCLELFHGQGVGDKPTSGKGTLCPSGGASGIGGGCVCDCHGAGGPGLVGPCWGWFRLTKSKPESESMSDSLGNW